MRSAAEIVSLADAKGLPADWRDVSNDSLYDETRAVIAGGGSSNMRNAGVPMPLVVSSAKGCRIRDVEGNELLDLNMGYGPHLFGYDDQDVLGAIADQLKRSSMTGLPHMLDHEAGELITALVPSIEQLRFANSGTEALASAVRLARTFTGRPDIVTFEGHYHGWSETLLRSPASPANRCHGVRRPTGGAPGMIPEAHDHTFELPFNDVAALDRVFAEHGRQLAAVLVEPVCANAGVVAPADGFLEHLIEVARRHGTLVVFDEVITGFRLAGGGAQELFGLVPDITVVSKALGGGFPVAAFGASRAVMEPLAANRAMHAGVYAGNHLAMRAVVATLTKVLNSSGLYATLDRKGAAVEAQVRRVLDDAGVPARVVRVGSLMSVALLHEPPDGDLRTDCAVDAFDLASYRRLQIECQARGLYFHPNPLEPWFISTAHQPADIEEAGDILADALPAALQGGR